MIFIATKGSFAAVPLLESLSYFCGGAIGLLASIKPVKRNAIAVRRRRGCEVNEIPQLAARESFVAWLTVAFVSSNCRVCLIAHSMWP